MKYVLKGKNKGRWGVEERTLKGKIEKDKLDHRVGIISILSWSLQGVQTYTVTTSYTQRMDSLH